MHGDVHASIPVVLSSWQNLFVYLVILLLPIVAVVLMWTRFANIGLPLLLASMTGGLLFDIYHHYIFVSPDNIAHLPPASDDLHSQFVWTAHALTLIQVIGVGLAAYFWRGRQNRMR